MHSSPFTVDTFCAFAPPCRHPLILFYPSSVTVGGFLLSPVPAPLDGSRRLVPHRPSSPQSAIASIRRWCSTCELAWFGASWQTGRGHFFAGHGIQSPFRHLTPEGPAVPGISPAAWPPPVPLPLAAESRRSAHAALPILSARPQASHAEPRSRRPARPAALSSCRTRRRFSPFRPSPHHPHVFNILDTLYHNLDIKSNRTRHF